MESNAKQFLVREEISKAAFAKRLKEPGSWFGSERFHQRFLTSDSGPVGNGMRPECAAITYHLMAPFASDLRCLHPEAMPSIASSHRYRNNNRTKKTDKNDFQRLLSSKSRLCVLPNINRILTQL